MGGGKVPQAAPGVGTDKFKADAEAIRIENDRVEEELRQTAGRASRDTSIANRAGAVNAATTTIDTALKSEEANALLRGVKFEANPEGRQSRIDSQFGELFSEDNEAQLTRLLTDFGTPEGFDLGVTKRGSVPAKPKANADAPGVAPTSRAKPSTILTDNELGAAGTILG